MGHEPVGAVEAVGAGVDGWVPGQAVTGGFGPAFADGEAWTLRPGSSASTASSRILGYHQGPPRSVDFQAWNWKAIDVINGHVRRRELLNDSITRGLELVRLGRIQPKSLVTHRFRLEDVGRAFRALETKPEGFIKAVVDAS